MGFIQPTQRREFWLPLQAGQSVAVSNNGYLNLRPFQNVNTTAGPIPSWVRSVEVRGLMVGFTTNPVANTFQFSFLPYITAGNAAFGTPEGSETTTSITATQNYNNGSNNYRYIFTSTYQYNFPSASITDAEISGFYSLLIRLKNVTGGNLTTTGDNWFGGMAVCY